MPPMMPPWPPYPPPRRGGRGVLIGLLTVALAISLLVNLVLFLVALMGAGPEPGAAVQRVERSGDRSQTVAIIPVFGMMLDDVEQQFRQDLETARNDSNVKAVVIHLDTPGGTVTDSHQMYEALNDFRQATGKPVVVHMDSVAASGGYFLACAADEIVAEESTITGSIGVLISWPQLSEFAEKTGIRFETRVAEGAPHKNTLDMWSAPTEEAMADVQALLDQQHELFRRVVQAGRAKALADRGTDLDDVTNGKVWLGPEAHRLGLVDTVGFIDDALAAAASRAGLGNPNVVRYSREPTLAELFGLASTNVEGLSLNAAMQSRDFKRAATGLLHELATPHALYLYRGVQ